MILDDRIYPKSREELRRLDEMAGASLRQLRTARGMSQTALGDAIGLTFQQVQKYEKGANRISVSRLCQLAEVLDFSPVQFFADIHEMDSQEPDTVELLMKAMSSPRLSALVENLVRIDDDNITASIEGLVDTIARERAGSKKSEKRRLLQQLAI